MSIRGKTAVVGIGETPTDRLGSKPGEPKKSTAEYLAWAARLAMEDAGLTKKDFDGQGLAGGVDRDADVDRGGGHVCNSATVLTTICVSKSRPASRSRYSCVGRAKQLWLTTPFAMKSPVPVVMS